MFDFCMHCHKCVLYYVFIALSHQVQCSAASNFELDTGAADQGAEVTGACRVLLRSRSCFWLIHARFMFRMGAHIMFCCSARRLCSCSSRPSKVSYPSLYPPTIAGAYCRCRTLCPTLWALVTSVCFI